jgi:cell division septation protein DedD
MPSALKTRLIGASVLIALAVIVVPMFFSAEPPQSGGEQSISLDIPPPPDRELQTRTMSVAPQGAGSVAAAQAVPSDRLATVDIESRRPQDVMPEDTTPTASAQPPATVSAQPPATASAKPAATPPPPKPAPAPEATKPAPSTSPGAAATGSYSISLGAYADRSNAEALVTKVRALGYPVAVSGVTSGGKPAAKVTAGPFDSRAAAEAARLKIRARVPGAPATLVAAAAEQKGDAPASALPAGRAGGWAVQIGAYSSQADANKLRDRLRAAGFDGYVDDVMSGGRKLWRVRVGPQTQRDDAVQVGAQVKSKLNLPGVVVTVP